MLGKGSSHVEECLKDGFVGVGWFEDIDLKPIFAKSADWKAFNKEMAQAPTQKPSRKNEFTQGSLF